MGVHYEYVIREVKQKKTIGYSQWAFIKLLTFTSLPSVADLLQFGAHFRARVRLRISMSRTQNLSTPEINSFAKISVHIVRMKRSESYIFFQNHP